MTDLLTDHVMDPGPGVHVVVHDDPLAAGRVIAERINARLVDTPVEAEAAVHHRVRLPELRAQRERLDQIEMLAWGLPEAEDQTYLARERELERVSRRRPIDIGAVERIASLTTELESLEQVRTGTERRVREEMIDALGAATPHTVVLHPTSIRTAAARVQAAEEALADARLALDLVPVHVPTMSVTEHHDEPPVALAPAEARSMGRVAAALVIGLVATLVAVAGELPIFVAVVPAVIGVIVALVLLRARRTAARSEVIAPPAPPMRDARPAEPDERIAQRTDAVRRIEERLRSARRDWGLAAGFEADPEDVDDVIRRRDPQFDLTADLVAAAPSARAVAAVHRRVRADWRCLWASLGRSAPPPDKPLVTALVQDVRNVVMLPGEAADALRRSETRADRARRRLALEAALGGEDLSELRLKTPARHDLDDRSLVLVSPFFPLAEQRRMQLRSELESLPDDVTVVVVVAHESEVPPRAEVTA
ncbi:MAG: hypothetical protein JOY78_20710 [Pseudonocardia sp.]|nr:hypothetical protein [Pseudonocardia sp.]